MFVFPIHASCPQPADHADVNNDVVCVVTPKGVKSFAVCHVGAQTRDNAKARDLANALNEAHYEGCDVYLISKTRGFLNLCVPAARAAAIIADWATDRRTFINRLTFRV